MRALCICSASVLFANMRALCICSASVLSAKAYITVQALARRCFYRGLFSAYVLVLICEMTGKVFTREELLAISDIVRDHPRLMVISDEVYKYMVYGCGDSSSSDSDSTTFSTTTATNGDITSTTTTTTVVQRGGALSPIQHVHFATLPGMWDRTVTISSAGKTFSVTGWQVGWVLGPRWLIQQVQTALPYMQFCAATPLQVRRYFGVYVHQYYTTAPYIVVMPSSLLFRHKNKLSC
jgi:bifunctional pyridoxal-dependent enzyme with beta-cystathionase and maltose regulon repressor activities